MLRARRTLSEKGAVGAFLLTIGCYIQVKQINITLGAALMSGYAVIVRPYYHKFNIRAEWLDRILPFT
ncbi:hypothetical protein CBP12_11950 [Oceanisphaera avium]|uniref:Uncharacterized protein n=1 Tax=Oceanisphaera avium TaxID=1903694 RepID=A0A1Y0CZQ7_9GAMM|nr:hypothetical protein CBP12_11950 [Oceanisphaera avium]